MDLKNTFEKIKPWLKPGMTCLLGLILLLRPSSITNPLATAVGFLITLVGAGLIVYFFTHKPSEYLKLVAGIILLVMGFSVIKDPASLVKHLTRFIGIIVLLYAMRGYLKKDTPHSQPISTATCILGVVLLVMPGAVSRLVFTVCGIGLLIVGAGMLIDQKKAGSGAADSSIVDAE